MRRLTASPSILAALSIVYLVLRPRSDCLWREDVVNQLLLHSCELAVTAQTTRADRINCADYAAGQLRAGKGPNAKVVWQCQEPWLEYSEATQSAYVLVRKSASMSLQRMLRHDTGNPFNATPHAGKFVAVLSSAVSVYTFVREPLSHFAAGFAELEVRLAVRETHPSEKVRAARAKWHTQALQQGLYVQHPLFSETRVRAFVVELVTGQLDDLFLTGDIDHVYPQAASFCKYAHRLRFMGRVEELDTDIGTLRAALRVEPAEFKAPSVNSAVGSPVKLEAQQSVYAAFRHDEGTRGLLCLLLAADYLLLRHLYVTPPECEDAVTMVGDAASARPHGPRDSQQLPSSLWEVSPRSRRTNS